MQICDQVSNSCRIVAMLRGDETGFGQAFFACCHQRAVELEKMHHAQVDLSDRGRIIVDQADAATSGRGCATSTSSSSSRLMADS